MKTSTLSKTASIIVAIISVMLGYLHFLDLHIDPRIKLIHFISKNVISYGFRNGPDQFDRSLLAKSVPLVTLAESHTESNVDIYDLTLPVTLDLPKIPYKYDYTEIECRVFIPKTEGKKETLVYFHGGAFVLGNPKDVGNHKNALFFAANLSFVVISVKYHLAPEFKFPAQLIDSISTIKWVSEASHPLLKEHVDTNKIHIGGESSGGQVSALSSRYIRDELPGIRIKSQILIYPSMGQSPTHHPDMFDPKFKDGSWMLPAKSSNLFRAAVLGPNYEYLNTELWSPLSFSNYAKLPPTVFILGGNDSLTKGSRVFKELLEKSNVPVKEFYYENAVHGFFGLDFLHEYHLVRSDLTSYVEERRKSLSQ